MRVTALPGPHRRTRLPAQLPGKPEPSPHRLPKQRLPGHFARHKGTHHAQNASNTPRMPDRGPRPRKTRQPLPQDLLTDVIRLDLAAYAVLVTNHHESADPAPSVPPKTAPKSPPVATPPKSRPNADPSRPAIFRAAAKAKPAESQSRSASPHATQSSPVILKLHLPSSSVSKRPDSTRTPTVSLRSPSSRWTSGTASSTTTSIPSSIHKSPSRPRPPPFTTSPRRWSPAERQPRHTLRRPQRRIRSRLPDSRPPVLVGPSMALHLA